MKITEPKVELWSEENISPESHIAHCSRICYGKEYKEPDEEADKKLVDGLEKHGHLSMLRHASVYFHVTDRQDLPMGYEHCPWVNRADNFLSTNLQEILHNGHDMTWAMLYKYGITNKAFLECCKKDKELFGIYRLTFCITTQISTSRELNRVSPNNISERSTRYCTSKDGLKICRPWWYDNDKHGLRQHDYNLYCQLAEDGYNRLLAQGLKPEDARGVLPLDTATKVIYTYSVQEWKHIIDLRYYGTTGKPHPNAKLVIGMVREQINQFAKENNIDFQV